MRHALSGNSADAAYGARQPAIVELQGPRQVGALAAVGAVPFSGQGGQLPDGVDVAGPAIPQFVGAVVLAQHGISPPPQLSQPRAVGVVVQAERRDRDRAILATDAAGYTTAAIGRSFGLSRTSVIRIVRGEDDPERPG